MKEKLNEVQLIATDPRLGWAARGLLTWIINQKNADLSVSTLINETARAARPAKREAVHATLRELTEAGYLRRAQRRLANGQLSRTHYQVFVPPIANHSEPI